MERTESAGPTASRTALLWGLLAALVLAAIVLYLTLGRTRVAAGEMTVLDARDAPTTLPPPLAKSVNPSLGAARMTQREFAVYVNPTSSQFFPAIDPDQYRLTWRVSDKGKPIIVGIYPEARSFRVSRGTDIRERRKGRIMAMIVNEGAEPDSVFPFPANGYRVYLVYERVEGSNDRDVKAFLVQQPDPTSLDPVVSTGPYQIGTCIHSPHKRAIAAFGDKDCGQKGADGKGGRLKGFRFNRSRASMLTEGSRAISVYDPPWVSCDVGCCTMALKPTLPDT